MERLQILLVEDEEDNISSFELCCGDNWDITAARHPKEVIGGNIDPNNFDLVIADLVFNVVEGQTLPPDPEDGRQLLEWLSKEKPMVPVIVLSGWVDPVTKHTLSKQFPRLQFIEKPANLSSPDFRQLVSSTAKPK